MDTTIRPISISPRLLAAAPHRLLFLVGAANVLLAMLWWTLSMVATRWHTFALSGSPIPAGWLHALVMQYQVLTPFMFGFLLTVFPRWMSQPALTRRHYLPVGLGLLGGQLLTLLGALGHPGLLIAGVALTLAGWLVGWSYLLGVLWRDEKTTWHALSCAVALALGAFGLGLILAYLATGNAMLAFVAIKFGSFGLLLPIYFTVCHRMLPFFAGSAIPGYRAWRPMAALAAFWILVLAHLGLELVHGYAALWLVDLPLAALCAALLWRWWPRAAAVPLLLRVLFIGFAWLPIAFTLYAGQSLWFAASGDFVAARAPAHALFIGYFGSLLVAMVTRVTQGHSGRPLELGGVAAFAFALVQLVALTRIAAEFAPDAQAWQILAAAGWLLAFLPWVLRSGWIYLTPRADGQPG